MFRRRREPETRYIDLNEKKHVDTEAGYPDPPWVVPMRKSFELVDPYSPKTGVWVVYTYDVGPVVRQVMPSPIRAIEALDHGDHIAWWPFGLDLITAIQRWDAHCGEVNQNELENETKEMPPDDEPSG